MPYRSFTEAFQGARRRHWHLGTDVRESTTEPETAPHGLMLRLSSASPDHPGHQSITRLTLSTVPSPRPHQHRGRRERGEPATTRCTNTKIHRHHDALGHLAYPRTVPKLNPYAKLAGLSLPIKIMAFTKHRFLHRLADPYRRHCHTADPPGPLATTTHPGTSARLPKRNRSRSRPYPLTAPSGAPDGHLHRLRSIVSRASAGRGLLTGSR